MNHARIRRHRYALFLDDSLRRAMLLSHRRYSYRLPAAQTPRLSASMGATVDARIKRRWPLCF